MAAPSVEIHRTSIDGVTTLWSDLGGDFTGALIIGAGTRDLQPRDVGLHHLVEHLVMSRVGPVRIEHNASSSPTSIVFWATGSPERVADFLGRVADAARTVGETTEAELAVSRATVLSEVGPSGLYAHRGPLAARWGAAGLGLADLGHAALLDLGTQDVRAFAARHLVTGAARLVLTGPPPAGLALRLPAGPAPARAPHPAPLDMPTPAVAYCDGDLSFSLLCDAPRAVRAVVGSVVRETLLRRLRLETGHVYAVDMMTFFVAGETSSWTFIADPATPAAAQAALTSGVRALRALGTDGPDEDVLEHVYEAIEEDWGLLDARRGWLLWVAEAEACDELTPLLPWATPPRDVTAEQVRDAVAGMLGSLLVTYPRQLVTDNDPLAALEEELGLTAQEPLRTFAGMSRKEIMIDLAGGGADTHLASALVGTAGSVHKGRFFGPHRGSEIWLGPRQIVLTGLGKITIDDLVLVGEDDDHDVELVTRTGASVFVNPAHFRGAAKPWARFLANVPPHLVRSKRGLEALAAQQPAVDGQH